MRKIKLIYKEYYLINLDRLSFFKKKSEYNKEK